MEALSVQAHLTIVSHFEPSTIRRQRYNNVVISVKQILNARHFQFQTKQKTFTIPLSHARCHLTHLMSHGLVTIAYNNPRQDYMIRTYTKDDNVLLLNIVKGNLTYSKEKDGSLVSEKVCESLLKQSHIKDLASKLKVSSGNFSSKCVDLSEKKLTGLPMGFGDLELRDLILDCNLLGPRLDYWSWAFGQIRHTLYGLSLTKNKLVSFPMEILALKKLKSLDLAENDLRTVPSALFCPKRELHSLNLESNTSLCCLPLFNKRFLSLNVVNCPKLYVERNIEVRENGIPDLKYFAGRIALKHNLVYEPSDLPRNLITYLNNHIECALCRNCVPKYAHSKLVYTNSPARETLTNSVHLSFQQYLCFECLQLNERNGN